MNLYNETGALIFPKPRKQVETIEKIDFISACYCINGHNLISNAVMFNDYPGIFLKIRNENEEGFIGISPICGMKNSISLHIKVKKGQRYDFYCTTCDEKLPVYSPCPSCNGNLIALFLDQSASFSHCIGICSIAGCQHAEIRRDFEIRNILKNKYSDSGSCY